MNTLATAHEPVRYVVIDDEPLYRQGFGVGTAGEIRQVGGYRSVEDFLALQREPCHVVVLDLCLNRQTGDKAVLQGVRAIRQLVEEFNQRVLVYSAEERPEPVGRCVAAGAAGYVSKYGPDTSKVVQAIEEIGRNGRIVTQSLHDELRCLIRSCPDIRLSGTLEETLILLRSNLSNAEIAERRQRSVRTIEDHKEKIKQIFAAELVSREKGYAELVHDLGIGPGDLVNDEAGQRPVFGRIARRMPWSRGRSRR
ncbi:response regulator transcription factor [Microbispora sp. NPDC088329]|uniref:response regulator transcription factor n=1 Tax=Microbispora sp. NPDC088329 TaxID=3154869 RepID=UPI00342CF118